MSSILSPSTSREPTWSGTSASCSVWPECVPWPSRCDRLPSHYSRGSLCVTVLASGAPVTRRAFSKLQPQNVEEQLNSALGSRCSRSQPRLSTSQPRCVGSCMPEWRPSAAWVFFIRSAKSRRRSRRYCCRNGRSMGRLGQRLYFTGTSASSGRRTVPKLNVGRSKLIILVEAKKFYDFFFLIF